MIVDTSVLMALLLEEPQADHLLATLLTSSIRRISAGTWIELAAVTSKRPELDERLHAALTRLSLVIAPVDEQQAALGFRAYREFGKGNHPAKLNFGDCFAYALSKATGEPLLFKGDDFAKTDVIKAL